jgi:hypothetical protein
VSPFEEFLCRGEVCHPPPVPRPAARFKFLHQNPIVQLKAKGALVDSCRHRPVQYLNKEVLQLF